MQLITVIGRPMSLNPIGIAVPVFFGLMALEYWVAKRRNVDVFRLNDTIADLSCGMGDQLIALILKIWVVYIYTLAFDAFALMSWEIQSVGTWVVGFVGVDLCYYAYHRFSHRVNLGWATHVVHHQSEEYNLAVALRQPWFSMAFSWVFYLPLAILGLPVVVYMTAYAFNLLYQFWIHTRLIKNMGMFGWVFNTPSHHRVHHGTNPEYIDKNYGGILIVWDRLFGTFAAEEVEPTYGVMKPIRTWNAFTANVKPITDLLKRSLNASTPTLGLKTLVMPPEWTPQGSASVTFPAPGRGYDESPPNTLKIYTLLNLVPVGVVTALMLTFEQSLELYWLYIASGYIIWSLIAWAGFFENRTWGYPVEMARLLSLFGVGMYWFITASQWLTVLGGMVSLTAGAALMWFAFNGRVHAKTLPGSD